MGNGPASAFAIALHRFWFTIRDKWLRDGSMQRNLLGGIEFGLRARARESRMLRKSLLGIAMSAVVLVAGAAVAEPAANGAARNQAALAVAGRITPQMRAVARQCAAVAGPARVGAARTPCSVSQLSGAGSAGVALGATAAIAWGTYEALHKGNSTPPTPPAPPPVSS